MQLLVSQNDWKKVTDYLKSTKENMAFIYINKGQNNKWICKETLLLTGSDYRRQSIFGVELNDHMRLKIVKQAISNLSGVIEVHAHWRQAEDVDFSPTDEQGLKEVVPHMLWRLRGMPYGAIVISESSYLGIIWNSRDESEKIKLIIGELDMATKPPK